MYNNPNPVISHMISHGGGTVPEVAESLGVSIGTATKLISTLCEEGLVLDTGTVERGSGRKPHRYELNPAAAAFLGVDITENAIGMGIVDLSGEMILPEVSIPFNLNDTPRSLSSLVSIISSQLSQWEEYRGNIKMACANVSGRVNTSTGRSNTFFAFTQNPLSQVLSESIGVPFMLSNDTHSMAFASFVKGGLPPEMGNVIFINLNWGLGVGIFLEGKPYLGKSGYAGEFGHVYGYDNEILCRCGKKGCLETEISGQAFCRNLTERIRGGESSILGPRVLDRQEPLTLPEAMDALKKEDILCIEVMENIGQELGKHIAGLMNLFNPDLVVIGGALADAGEYLLQPLKISVNKYCLQLVNQDTEIRLSSLHGGSGVLGACLVARSRYYGG